MGANRVCLPLVDHRGPGSACQGSRQCESAACAATPGQDANANAPKPKKWVVVESPAIIDGAELRSANAVQARAGADEYEIAFSLKPSGAAKFGAWTGANIDQYMGVDLNDEIKSIAFIKSRIDDQGQIEGHFTKQQGDDLALTLRSGALPAGIEVQILDDNADRYKELKSYQYSSSLYAIVPAEPRVSKPPGDWNTMTIRCEGTKYEDLDLHYIERLGPWMDLRILLATAAYFLGNPCQLTRRFRLVPMGEAVEGPSVAAAPLQPRLKLSA